MTRQRSALVTGGGRGIGAATCMALAADGIDLAINYRSDRAAADRIAAQVRDMGRRAEIFAADIADETSADWLGAQVLDAFGAVDILINNAGFGTSVAGRPGVTELRLDHVDLLMRAHVYGPIALCRRLVPQMRALGRGDVVMVSSVAVQSLSTNMATYVMAKAAMEALAHVLAREERGNGVHVNIVAPGLTDTDMGLGLMQRTSGVQTMREVDAGMPFGFVCQPADIANAIAFLVSERGRYVNGQRITVDGGTF